MSTHTIVIMCLIAGCVIGWCAHLAWDVLTAWLWDVYSISGGFLYHLCALVGALGLTVGAVVLGFHYASG